eukprot:TRINITY_DN53122_c0_g1_i1.p1 TRINITY_DN53122_c0_g1~~TRINITY_DN53122_c0_g1_i1.p1  ORF type:complete len:101 (-),score=17.31 TRINITY_DN53122_c0_g1_i1:31-333(-)
MPTSSCSMLFVLLIVIVLRLGKAEWREDEPCTVREDCYENGKMCDGLMDAGCICKEGMCKISSGCGTMGAFFSIECADCGEEDCEDEGACKWVGGECIEI